ncbi:hypothetical protein EVAR_10690_1 [Eumeta japonica]|uniref:Uncharacterized protein n=1 Tax=Eumeta variegata TaxID=151549 RepID=A0A4C1U7D8_EUMVA|nr:hypothetical protein EVAR_10690_1 [Eumeta japonica]
MQRKKRQDRRPLPWYSLCSEQQHQILQAQQNFVLRMIAKAGWYVKNDVIARDVRVQYIEDFVRLQALYLFNYADEGPILLLHNLTFQYKRPPGGHQLLRVDIHPSSIDRRQ